MNRCLAMVLLCALPLHAKAQALRLEGEIAAQQSVSISPPSVDGQWQYQITQLLADGSAVKKDQVVVAFDAGDLQRRLVEAQSKLNEKRSERERLLLDLAERERTEKLSIEEQRAELAKATRKAEQPAELLRSVDYKKLVVERQRAESRQSLIEQRDRASDEQRRAERELVEAEVTQLSAEAAMLATALGQLQVKAPRDGVLVVRSGWRGERFEVGTQVFMGQSVAEIPDPTTLVVRATATERDLFRVQQGQAATVRIEGGAGRQFDATVTRVGASVRSKSRRQPVPVVDVELAIRGSTLGLRPGQAVSVSLQSAVQTDAEGDAL